MSKIKFLLLSLLFITVIAASGCSNSSSSNSSKNPDSNENILINGDMEDASLGGWVSESSSISYEKEAGVDGSQALLISDREADYASAGQNITTHFARGKSFYVEGYFKSAAADKSKKIEAGVTLELKCFDKVGTAPDDGYVWLSLKTDSTFDGNGYTKVSGTFSANQINSSTELEVVMAKIYFQSSDESEPYYIDNCVVKDLNPEIEVVTYNPAAAPEGFPVYAPEPSSDASDYIKYNPYAEDHTYALKGAIHMHTKSHTNDNFLDDGVTPITTPTKMATWYKDNGYDFITFTDHDKFTTDKPVAGLIYIPGEEVTTADGDACVLGITEVLRPGLSRQLTINDAYQHGKALTAFNHPLDSAVADAGKIKEHLDAIKNLWSIEIFNGGRTSDNPTAYWDYILTKGKFIWGHAGEDAHSTDEIEDGEPKDECGRGWDIVYVQEKTVANILKNLAAGNFYGTTGPDMDISVTGNTISVSTTTGTSILWYQNNGNLIKSTAATSDSYTLVNTEGYVRVVVRNSSGKAWSQPIFTKKMTEIPAPNALFTNGDFEIGSEGWVEEGDAVLNEETTTVHGGIGSLLITGRTDPFDGPKQEFVEKLKDSNGITYHASAYVRAAAGLTGTIQLCLQIKTSDPTGESVYYDLMTSSVTITDSAWVKVEGDIKAEWPTANTYLKSRLIINSADDMIDFYVDDVEFTKK